MNKRQSSILRSLIKKAASAQAVYWHKCGAGSEKEYNIASRKAAESRYKLDKLINDLTNIK